jgi:hypothetical protein
LKSQVLPEPLQNAFPFGPESVNVLSVKDENTTSARAASVPTINVNAAVAATNFKEVAGTVTP